MSEIWKKCEGQLVDNRYPLLQFLGNTNHSAVFLTELPEPQHRKAVIKFISADMPTPDQQLAIWQRVERLSHPHLLRLFNHGRSRVGGMDVLYVAMERADENLSEFLPQRGLNPQEARDVLNPLLDALAYLHGQSLVHFHVKPSNLLAIADLLKLSSDTVYPDGKSREAYRDFDVYDAPENSAASTIHTSVSADIWSLGITIVESLTQLAPSLPSDHSADPTNSDTLPQPFLEIVRHSLLRDPAQRWTIAEIGEHLHPAAVAVAASATAAVEARLSSAAPSATTPESRPEPVVAPASVSPLSVPLATEPVRLKKLPVRNAPVTRRAAPLTPEKTFVIPSYVIPVFLGIVLFLGAILTLPKIFRNLPSQSVSTASTAVPAPPPAKTATVSPSTNSSAKDSPKALAESKPATEPVRPKAVAAPPEARPATSSSAQVAAKSSVAMPNHGEVLDQVLPQASPKALSTIQGTVRVLVRVHVDPVGNVTSAEFESPGPSKYFSDIALRAAQRWQFASPVSEGHSLPSQWLIRFEFSQRGVIAVPAQKQP